MPLPPDDRPRLGSDWITTSRLIALDRAAGRARTLSRWYRLGAPFHVLAAAVAKELALDRSPPGPGF